MNEIIKINYDNDRPTVLARDLHDFLEVQTPYHKWFPRMCEYGFTENVDYAVTDNFVHNPAGGPQHQQDAQLTIEMAKEICMLQRNERGKQARQYFIQLEKDWNSPEFLPTPSAWRATRSGITKDKVSMNAAFHIDGEFVEIHGIPEMREDMVRVGMGTADIRYRGEFKSWYAVIPVKYNASSISLEQLVNLFNLGGFACGVGEWRAEKGGAFGMFHVE